MSGRRWSYAEWFRDEEKRRNAYEHRSCRCANADKIEVAGMEDDSKENSVEETEDGVIEIVDLEH